MTVRVVVSVPVELAGVLRDRAAAEGTAFDQVVGAAYRSHHQRLRDGWRPPGTAAGTDPADPFARPVRTRSAQGVATVQLRLASDGVKALDDLGETLGLWRHNQAGERVVNRSAVVTTLLAAEADADREMSPGEETSPSR